MSLALKEQPQRTFLSDIEKNRKECMAVVLRSGKELQSKPMGEEFKEGKAESSQGKEKKEKKAEDIQEEEPELVYVPPPPYKPPIPFSQRFRKQELEAQFGKFLDIFKKLEVNIPFAEALAQMPNYAKFTKEIMSNKKKLESFSTIGLSESCSVVIQKKMPEKLKDPGSFTIPCVIGEHTFNKALCDLGANINLMPLSMVEKLKLGELSPTSLSLQMADRSLTYLKGIIEDVLVKVGDFIFLVNFFVLDMKEDKEVPLILGRPFLATGQALIDVKNAELTLRVGLEKVKFNLQQNMKFPDNEC